MDTQLHNPIKTFQPRPSYGWAWLILMAVIIFALAIAPALAMGLSSSGVIVTVIICSLVAVAFLVLAFWFPTMRYELGQDDLTLRYGAVLTYRIPLTEIRTIRRRNLSLTIWSTVRFPGIALFKVPYADVGNVKMCATAALNNILLVETEKEKYGLTPADEEAFIAAVRTQMEHK
ncbi:MAG TPA: PH domain-containing protein [Anaerolineales bacterium]|nr:PH domain-containing protein [Anaerolineales bacterium]HLO31194.1 PH domain-containing protein [Anaerolineales bacterium]